MIEVARVIGGGQKPKVVQLKGMKRDVVIEV